MYTFPEGVVSLDTSGKVSYATGALAALQVNALSLNVNYAPGKVYINPFVFSVWERKR